LSSTRKESSGRRRPRTRGGRRDRLGLGPQRRGGGHRRHLAQVKIYDGYPVRVGPHPRVTSHTTVRKLPGIGPWQSVCHLSPGLQVHLPMHADGRCCACNPEDVAVAPSMPFEQQRWPRLTVP
jgi:hypothetical protein